MHAIICQENGSHYISMVFGYYRDRATRSYYADYWIVWDSKQERLIKWPTFKPKKKLLEKQILIVDAEQNDWKLNQDGEGCVKFLNRNLLD